MQACSLGLMGYQADGVSVKANFNPHGQLTRAEVATILSRLLRGEKHAGDEEQWYQGHLVALKEAKIMHYIEEPFMTELRGNIFLLLSRLGG